MRDNLVCLACYEVFNPNQIREGGLTFCPRYKCGATRLIELDDFMVETIIVLHKKRYETMFCCMGHLPLVEAENIHWKDPNYEEEIYICFSEMMEYIIKDNIPQGFNFMPVVDCGIESKYPQFCSVRCDLLESSKSLSHSEKIMLIAEKNKVLYEWAVSLPFLDTEN